MQNPLYPKRAFVYYWKVYTLQQPRNPTQATVAYRNFCKLKESLYYT